MKPVSELNVLLAGMGGLGCPAALALAQAGVRRFTLVDPDRVDLTNLHRQLWHRGPDVGRAKVASAAEKLARAFPGVSLQLLEGRVSADNGERLLRAHDLIFDGTDSVETKLALSDLAVGVGATLVYGGVVRMQGQAMVIRPGGPCLRCLFEGSGGDDGPTCAGAGVLGPLAGLVGALQVRLVLEERANPLAADVARLLVVEGMAGAVRTTRVRRNPSCGRCKVAA